MSATKLITPTPEMFKMMEMIDTGATNRVLAAAFGITVGQLERWLREISRYKSAMDILKDDPQSLEGLGYLGKIDGAAELQLYGAQRLSDLCEWSESELRLHGSYCLKFGPKRIEKIKAAMAEHGLTLHADREEPIMRVRNWENLHTPDEKQIVANELASTYGVADFLFAIGARQGGRYARNWAREDREKLEALFQDRGYDGLLSLARAAACNYARPWLLPEEAPPSPPSNVIDFEAERRRRSAR